MFTKRMIATALVVTLLFACSKSSLISNANDVISSLQSAQPLINQLLPSAAPKIEQALSIAGKLKDAIAASDSTTALGYLGDLIPTFQSIVRDDIPQIHDPAVRTEIMAALALADIALHYLVNHIQAGPPQGTVSAIDAIGKFKKEPVWGERYRRK